MKTTYRKSCPGNLFQSLIFTFDPFFSQVILLQRIYISLSSLLLLLYISKTVLDREISTKFFTRRLSLQSSHANFQKQLIITSFTSNSRSLFLQINVSCTVPLTIAQEWLVLTVGVFLFYHRSWQMVEFRRQDTNIMKSLVTTVRSQSLLKYLVIIYR